MGYLQLDTQTQEKKIWVGHAQCFAEEPVFVPDSRGGEDSGWLLGLMYDHSRERSCLVILDAANVETGPVCRLWFTHHLAHGLHGSWTPKYFEPA